jgi:predicted enzyme related to lactoylglutathione lyase
MDRLSRGRDGDRCEQELEAMMITHVKFVSVPTSDQDRALKFWTGQVGFTLVTDQPFGESQRWIELAIRDSATRLVLFTPDGQEGRIGSFFNGALACDDVEATHRQLSERGVRFDGPPQKQPWGHFATFSDPDGNRFVLSSR